MIHYQLRCGAAHEFDGWFTNSEGFEQQAERGLINCPVCASTKVGRALMAPAVPKKNRVAPPAEIAVPEAPPPMAGQTQSAGGLVPDAVRAALHRLRAEVEKNCDYVGAEFAEEARKIHHGETKARAIYGESTEAEAEALADEGIEVSQIPWLPRSDS